MRKKDVAIKKIGMGNLTEGKERQNIGKRLKERKPEKRGFTKTKKERIPKERRENLKEERVKGARRLKEETVEEIRERRRFQKKRKDQFSQSYSASVHC